MSTSETRYLQEVADSDYKYGWVSNVEADTAPKGLNEDTIRMISSKKQEPEWMLEWRLKAFRHWQKLAADEDAEDADEPVDGRDEPDRGQEQAQPRGRRPALRRRSVSGPAHRTRLPRANLSRPMLGCGLISQQAKSGSQRA